MMISLYHACILSHAKRIIHTSVNKTRLFDCDVNLTHPHLKNESVELLQVAHLKASLFIAIIPGSSEEDSLNALKLIQSIQQRIKPIRCYSTFGQHPYQAKEEVTKTFLQSFKKHMDDVIAIGECGLDFSEGFPPVEEQLSWFRYQLDLACTYNKPLFLHERNAHELFMRELQTRKDKGLPNKLLVHCFTGNEEELRTYLDFGCYISVSGLICRSDKEGKRFRDVIKRVDPPKNRLLIETDAPYLGFPGCRILANKEQWKNSPNIPAAIIQVAEGVSRCLNRPLEQVCEDSYKAGCEFFNLTIE